MGGKNNRTKALARPRPVYRLPGQVVLATPVTVVAGKPGNNPFVSFCAYVYAMVAYMITFIAPVVRDVSALIATVFGPILYPMFFVIILAIAVAAIVFFIFAVAVWLIEKPIALFTMLVSAFSDPTLNGLARSATGISTVACFSFGHFCSQSAWAYQEPLLDLPVPARPIWDLILGSKDEIELSKHLAESAGSVGAVLQDLSLVGHQDHMVDVAAMRAFALNAKIGSDSVEQGDVREGLLQASKYGADMLSAVDGVASLSAAVLKSVRDDITSLVQKVVADGPSWGFYFNVRAVLSVESQQISDLIAEVEKVEAIAIKATQHFERFQPRLQSLYQRYSDAYAATPGWSTALDYAVSTLGFVFAGKTPSDLGYVRANLPRSHEAIEKLDKIKTWLSEYKDALNAYRFNLKTVKTQIPSYTATLFSAKRNDQAWRPLIDLSSRLDETVIHTLKIRHASPGLLKTILRDTFGRW